MDGEVTVEILQRKNQKDVPRMERQWSGQEGRTHCFKSRLVPSRRGWGKGVLHP